MNKYDIPSREILDEYLEKCENLSPSQRLTIGHFVTWLYREGNWYDDSNVREAHDGKCIDPNCPLRTTNIVAGSANWKEDSELEAKRTNLRFVYSYETEPTFVGDKPEARAQLRKIYSEIIEMGKRAD